MNFFRFPFSLNIQPYQSSLISTARNIVTITLVPLGLSGCLLTSPFWGQQFSSHTDSIPMQAWTTDNSSPIKFECAQAYHGGIYPPFEEATWHLVQNVTPSNISYSPSGDTIYGAGLRKVLPSQCWRSDPAYPDDPRWYAAIRATQAGATALSARVEFKTFDKAGLECLGRENGKAASWFGWINKGCTYTYYNSDQEVPYVRIRANS